MLKLTPTQEYIALFVLIVLIVVVGLMVYNVTHIVGNYVVTGDLGSGMKSGTVAIVETPPEAGTQALGKSYLLSVQHPDFQMMYVIGTIDALGNAVIVDGGKNQSSMKFNFVTGSADLPFMADKTKSLHIVSRLFGI